MAAANDEKDKKRFLELTRQKYAEQAKWYLNGFWKDGAEKEAEQIWKMVCAVRRSFLPWTDRVS